MARLTAFQGRHAMIDDEVYSGFTDLTEESALWHIAPHPTTFTLTDANYFHPYAHLAITTPWLHPQHPYLGLVPTGSRHTVFSAPLLSCILAWNPEKPCSKTIGWSNSQRGWSLERNLKRRWETLEKVLLEFSSIAERIAPSHASHPPSPSSYGYLRFHPSRTDAEAAFSNASSAFRLLLARLTLSLALLRHRDASRQDGDARTTWQDEVHAAGLSYQVISEVDGSVCGDFTAPRIGGVISTVFTNHAILEAFSTISAPLYLYWGAPAAFDSPFSPGSGTIHELQQLVSQQVQPAPPPPPATFKAEKHSRQRNGETWQAFFQRRAAATPRFLELEERDHVLKQTHRDRMANAQKESCPGKSSKTTVYYWELEEGNRIRRRVPKWQVSDYWSSGYHSRRRYNPYFDEWDVCSEFDPTECVNTATGDDDDWDEDDDGLQLVPQGPATPPLPPNPVSAKVVIPQLGPRTTALPSGPITPPLPSLLLSKDTHAALVAQLDSCTPSLPSGPITPPLPPLPLPEDIFAPLASIAPTFPTSSLEALPDHPPSPPGQSFDLLTLSEDLITQIHTESPDQVHLSFPDHAMPPSELASARYGLDLTAIPPTKRMKSAQHPTNLQGLLGGGFFNKEPWGTPEEWSRISEQFDSMMNGPTLPSFPFKTVPSIIVSSVSIDRMGKPSSWYILSSTSLQPGFSLLLSSPLDVMEVFHRGWDEIPLEQVAYCLSRRLIPFTPLIEGPSSTLKSLPQKRTVGLGY
jgi:hypothetical protein